MDNTLDTIKHFRGTQKWNWPHIIRIIHWFVLFVIVIVHCLFVCVTFTWWNWSASASVYLYTGPEWARILRYRCVKSVHFGMCYVRLWTFGKATWPHWETVSVCVQRSWVDRFHMSICIAGEPEVYTDCTNKLENMLIFVHSSLNAEMHCLSVCMRLNDSDS